MMDWVMGAVGGSLLLLLFLCALHAGQVHDCMKAGYDHEYCIAHAH